MRSFDCCYLEQTMKLATFTHQRKTRIGLVVEQSIVDLAVEIQAADQILTCRRFPPSASRRYPVSSSFSKKTYG